MILFTGSDNLMFEEFKKSMMVEFEMTDLGLMHYFLSIEVVQSTNGIFVSQKKYLREVLDRFQMKDCNPVSTPTEFGLKLDKDHEGKKVDSTLYKQIVGSLMYLTATRPDIMHSLFHGHPRSNLLSHCRLQKLNLFAATACACQAICLRKILEEPHFKQVGATTIFCDNNSTIKLSKNTVLHGISKHIDVKYYFLRDLNNDGVINLKYRRSEEQLADLFTKPLKLLPFQYLRKLMGICTLENLA
ncbi:uncharacterized protein LOC131180053 [Hevea brasiliensis]|uniref:uncharacterized protein LOC131180053 n=1 Tax=Hevea brasiliensis TaxID=3981 RepID=UPI0025D2C1B3|nr:uncharacterized protein LOC131180053 [Hevea brasiliensis]